MRETRGLFWHIEEIVPAPTRTPLKCSSNCSYNTQHAVNNCANAGKQCATNDINNGGIPVGTFILANPTGPAVAWVDEVFNDDDESADVGHGTILKRGWSRQQRSDHRQE